MAPVTVTKSRVALPWYGCVVLVIEIGAYSNTDTLVLSSIDGGQGISFVYGVLAFTNGGRLLPTIAGMPIVTTNGTTITMGTDTTGTTLIVFGR